MVNAKMVYASFYFDEDVSVVVAKIIRAHGFKVICASDVKRCGKNDEEQLKYAARNRHILGTHNIRDFIKLHSDIINKGDYHHGIILAVRRRDNYEFARRLLGLLQQIEPYDLDNQIKYI